MCSSVVVTTSSSGPEPEPVRARCCSRRSSTPSAPPAPDPRRRASRGVGAARRAAPAPPRTTAVPCRPCWRSRELLADDRVDRRGGKRAERAGIQVRELPDDREQRACLGERHPTVTSTGAWSESTMSPRARRSVGQTTVSPCAAPRTSTWSIRGPPPDQPGSAGSRRLRSPAITSGSPASVCSSSQLAQRTQLVALPAHVRRAREMRRGHHDILHAKGVADAPLPPVVDRDDDRTEGLRSEVTRGRGSHSPARSAPSATARRARASSAPASRPSRHGGRAIAWKRCIDDQLSITGSDHTGSSCRQTTSGAIARDQLDHLVEIASATRRLRVAVEDVPRSDHHAHSIVRAVSARRPSVGHPS